MQLDFDEIETPLGRLTLIARGEQLVALGFPGQRARLLERLARRHGPVTLRRVQDPAGITSRIRAFLSGDLRALERITVDPAGTPFERTVWGALRAIPAGTTISYGALAARIGRPRAVRAVGRANARNPVAVVIPCHRVVGVSGDLTGYAGGLPRKRWLLAHEATRGESLKERPRRGARAGAACP
jgi:methylated-DNA-[protein]-cysteine S-methyltransferase